MGAFRMGHHHRHLLLTQRLNRRLRAIAVDKGLALGSKLPCKSGVGRDTIIVSVVRLLTGLLFP